MIPLDAVDPRLAPAVQAEFTRLRASRLDGLPRGVTVVLVGHRAAGKSSLLPHVALRLKRTGVDLDQLLERQRPLLEWVRDDVASFRAAERQAYAGVPSPSVVAVGGGFLANHGALLRGALAVLVPITFETYVERLSRDTTRPRLRPELSLSDELRQVYDERERLHRAAPTMPLGEFLARLERGLRPRRVVTLPPQRAPGPFATHALAAGADLLEVRTDLTPLETDLQPAAAALPLLVSERGAAIPPHWAQVASLVDRERGTPGPSGTVISLHAAAPLPAPEAFAVWQDAPAQGQLKHVEPLLDPMQVHQLVETQSALTERHGAERVTVLATGPFATAARAVLSTRNALDYLRLDGQWAAAPGQRFLADAVREAQSPTRASRRLGILGSAVQHSRSPRIHQQPFDRLELPENVDLERLLASLHRWYRGLAITNPFKKRVATAVGAASPAINTLVATPSGWSAHNTDVAGAEAILTALGTTPVTALGDGGATEALRLAAASQQRELRVLTRATLGTAPLTGACVWTWPADVEVPPVLRFESASVAVIAYGPPGRRIAQQIRARGGTPLALGPRWLIAQARRQKSLWEAVP